MLDEIWPDPWQTDTCVGEWHYKRDIEYKTPKTIIDMLVDIVSKNGNLMLNFPLPNSGMLDDRELKILSAITDWMNVNGEAIFSILNSPMENLRTNCAHKEFTPGRSV